MDRAKVSSVFATHLPVTPFLTPATPNDTWHSLSLMK